MKRKRLNTDIIFFMAGAMLLISEIWKQYTINVKLLPEESYIWWYFPFQLCSTPMYASLLIGAVSFFRRREREKSEGLLPALYTYIASYGLLAGSMAFLDTSGFYLLGYAPLTVHSYVWHISLILLGVLAAAKIARENTASFSGATLIYFSGCMAAAVINFLAGKSGETDMFYINPALKMNQMCFRDIAEYAGNGTGILVYILSTVLGAAMIFIVILLFSPGPEKDR